MSLFRRSLLFSGAFLGLGLGAPVQGGPPPAAPLLSIEDNGAFAEWNGAPPSDLSGFSVTVAYDGFSPTGSATTVTEIFEPTVRVRRPWPNQSSLSASRVALSKRIYAGAVVNGGAVTNSSTLVSPRPFFEWHCHGYEVIGDSHTPRAFAVHIRGIACIRFIYSDGTNTVEAVASALQCEVSPTSGKAMFFYSPGPVNIGSLSNGRVTLRAIACPRIGTQVFDTNNNTNQIDHQCTLHFRKHTAFVAARPIAYIQTGAPGPGVVSPNDAAARAAPFPDYQTAGVAMMAYNNSNFGFNAIDGGVFRIFPGAAALGATNNRVQLIAAPIFQKHPTTVGFQSWPGIHNVRAGTKDAATPLQSAIFDGFAFASTSASGTMFLNQGGATHFILKNYTLDYAINTSASIAVAGSVTWAFEGSIVGRGTPTGYFSGNGRVTKWIGCRSTVALGATTLLNNSMHGCDWIGARIEGVGSVVHPHILVNTNVSRWLGVNVMPAAQHVGITGGAGGAFFGNVSIEGCQNPNGPQIGLTNDGFVGDTEHSLLWHVTIAGFNDAARLNLHYNDVRTGGPNGTGPNNRVLGASVIGLLTEGWVACKTELLTPNDGSQTGNWPFRYGVDCQGNFYCRGAQLADWNPEFSGPRSNSPQTANSVFVDPLFTDKRASVDASGTATAGFGNYTLLPGSPARNLVLNSPLPWDQNGVARGTELSAAGAFA